MLLITPISWRFHRLSIGFQDLILDVNAWLKLHYIFYLKLKSKIGVIHYAIGVIPLKKSV
ncbi:MAG: hypothetical protein JWR02_2475 [Mucilaginibacter sp.]|nr:hypothetical protein [Mucilaginibacter sp.]